MNRDTEELPKIMAEMEQHSHNIEGDQWVSPIYNSLSISMPKPNHW